MCSQIQSMALFWVLSRQIILYMGTSASAGEKMNRVQNMVLLQLHYRGSTVTQLWNSTRDPD